MENEKVIVAIEFGSSKIAGMAGVQAPDGGLKVLSYHEQPSSQFIHHGIVYNVTRTAEAIENIRTKIENDLDAAITQVYVASGGRSLRSVAAQASRDINDGSLVSLELIDEMVDEMGLVNQEGEYATVAVVSSEFVADHKNQAETDPVGIACSHLDGYCQRIVIRRHYMDLLPQCFNATNLELVDGFLVPTLTVDQVVTPEEKRQGCALVDYGADTTTLQVYKNGLLRYLRVIPLGSELITKDLMSGLKIEHDEAERLKRTYGLYNRTGASDTEEIVLQNSEKVRLKEVGEIIEARNEEIMVNVLAQIKASGYMEQLFAGIVLTGGGSNLKMLANMVKEKNPGHHARVVTAPVTPVYWADIYSQKTDGTCLALLSIMKKDLDNCVEYVAAEEPEQVEIAFSEEPKMVQGNLFTDEGESAQEEKDRKKKEQQEEKRRKAYEEKLRKKAEKAAREAQKPKRESMFKVLLGKLNSFVDEVQ